MVIFASAEDDSNWQGIFQLNFQMSFGTIIHSNFEQALCPVLEIIFLKLKF